MECKTCSSLHPETKTLEHAVVAHVVHRHAIHSSDVAGGIHRQAGHGVVSEELLPGEGPPQGLAAGFRSGKLGLGGLRLLRERVGIAEVGVGSVRLRAAAAFGGRLA